MKKPKARIYWRDQGGTARAYGDFRDLGGGREALIAEGEKRATSDPVIAEALVGKRLAQLQEARRDRTLLGVRRRAGLEEYAAEHLVKKKKSSRVTDGWLAADEHQLQTAIEFFGADRELASIAVEHVQEYAQVLSEKQGRHGREIAPATQRQYLNSLSNLFRRAQGEGLIRGVNPVQALMEKPSGEAGEAKWLEVWEAALLLEAARTYPYTTDREDGRAGLRLRRAIGERLGIGPEAEAEFVLRMRSTGKNATVEKLKRYSSGELEPTRGYIEAAENVLTLAPGTLHRPRNWHVALRVTPMAYPLIATYLLTGGRESEVYGLELRDVNLEREIVVFRKTARRRLKTRTSSRIVPLWPQLREILAPHIAQREKDGAEPDDLLFPSPVTGAILTDSRKMLDAISERVGWSDGDIRTKMFRHTYCAARLQTLEGGHPVALFTVGREMGHGGEALVKKVYGHLGRSPHRSEQVEYRIEQQRSVIPAERMRLLRRAV